MSLPSPPSSWSSPAPPRSVSLPGPPLKVLLSLLPIKVSSPRPPSTMVGSGVEDNEQPFYFGILARSGGEGSASFIRITISLQIRYSLAHLSKADTCSSHRCFRAACLHCLGSRAWAWRRWRQIGLALKYISLGKAEARIC